MYGGNCLHKMKCITYDFGVTINGLCMHYFFWAYYVFIKHFMCFCKLNEFQHLYMHYCDCFCIAGECDHCGAEVGSAEGTPLETADETTLRQLGVVRAHPRTHLGHQSAETRTDCTRRHHGRSRRNGSGGILEAGMSSCLLDFVTVLLPVIFGL